MSTANVIDLSIWQLALALVLVGAVVAVSVRQSLGLERDLVIGSVRTIAQLYVVGLVLAAVFAAARWYWVLLILATMTGVATQAAISRLGKPLPGGNWIAGIALTASTAATLAYVIGVVVGVRPWYEPQYISSARPPTYRDPLATPQTRGEFRRLRFLPSCCAGPCGFLLKSLAPPAISPAASI